MRGILRIEISHIRLSLGDASKYQYGHRGALLSNIHIDAPYIQLTST